MTQHIVKAIRNFLKRNREIDIITDILSSGQVVTVLTIVKDASTEFLARISCEYTENHYENWVLLYLEGFKE